MPDIFLYPGEASLNDVRLRDPTTSGGGGTSYTLVAESGSYVLTGQAATLKRGYRLDAATTSYALAGSAATLRVGRVLVAASGAYAITGQSAGLLRGYTLAADSAAYALAGQDATLTYTPITPPSAPFSGGGLDRSHRDYTAELLRKLRLKQEEEDVALIAAFLVIARIV